jgi:hypothetical protein
MNLRHLQASRGSKYQQTFTFEACRLHRIRRYRACVAFLRTLIQSVRKDG